MPSINFDEIALSKDEQGALNELANHNLLFDGESKEALNRLAHLGLAEKFQDIYNKKMCLIVRITDSGKDYLAYKKMEDEEKRKSNLHDWKIAIFSTIGGALLSQPLWYCIEWIISTVANLFRK